MKKVTLILFLLLSFVSIKSQTLDTIIVNKNFTSYFSYQTHTPLYVIYKLYKGGGNVSRNGMVFKTGGLIQSATDNDYSHSGYDIGHMVNAKDFAIEYNKEESTFRFYNALPQTPQLNRGIWKSIETKLREDSQTDSLLIICGGYNFNKKINNRVGIPEHCFKIIKYLKTKKLKVYIFPNDKSNTYKEITVEQLYTYIKYNTTYIKNTLH